MFATISDVLVKVVPIVLIIALGNVIRAKRILSASAIDEIKGLVVNVALPAVIFIAFLDMDLQTSYLGLFALILAVCFFLYGYGLVLRRAARIDHEYYPFLMTGFEFGMVGITLFGTAYGLDNVGYIAVVDLSHELFIWFVFVTLLVAKRDGVSSFGGTVKSFLKSPVIIAILAGLALNLLGLAEWFHRYPITAAVDETLGFLGDLLIPSILIIIGYGMGLSMTGIRDAMGVVLSRLVLLIPLALLVNVVFVRRLLDLDPAFEAAIFTFFVLPPPYIVPLFMKKDVEDEKAYVNNVLSVYTVFSLVIFVIYFVVNPTLAVG